MLTTSSNFLDILLQLLRGWLSGNCIVRRCRKVAINSFVASVVGIIVGAVIILFRAVLAASSTFTPYIYLPVAHKKSIQEFVDFFCLDCKSVYEIEWK